MYYWGCVVTPPVLYQPFGCLTQYYNPNPTIASVLLSLALLQQHSYQQSYYPKTIRDWNDLPTSSIEITNTQKNNLTELNVSVCIVVYMGFCTPWAHQQAVCPVINSNSA